MCVLDDVADSLLKTRHHRQLSSPHKAADVRHLLPLSVEAQFVRDIIDRVSVCYFCQLICLVVKLTL